MKRYATKEAADAAAANSADAEEEDEENDEEMSDVGSFSDEEPAGEMEL